MLDDKTISKAMLDAGFSLKEYPYLYNENGNYGICYSFVNPFCGSLTRLKFFYNISELNIFIKMLKSMTSKEIKIYLDNYEVETPNMIVTYKGKSLSEKEIAEFPNLGSDSLMEKLNDSGKVIYEAGKLLIFFDNKKEKYKRFFLEIVNLKKHLNSLYFELQEKVDKYNGEEKTFSVISDDAKESFPFDEALEIMIKQKYKEFCVNIPDLQTAISFVKEVWDLNKSLEISINYNELQDEFEKVQTDINIVSAKIKYIESLNYNAFALFKVNLVKKFRKINHYHLSNKKSKPREVVDYKSKINEKYSYFNYLNVLYLEDYLKEADYNSFYESIVNKYKKNINSITRMASSITDSLESLSEQYKNNLLPQEQAALILLNSEYRYYLLNILEIDKFENKSFKDIVTILKKQSDYSSWRKKCFELMKTKILRKENEIVRKQLFGIIDFGSYESFIMSLCSICKILVSISGKIVLPFKIFSYMLKFKEKYAILSADYNKSDGKDLIYFSEIDAETSVYYSPYYVDISKDTISIKNNEKVLLFLNLDTVNVFYSNYKLCIKNYMPILNEGEPVTVSGLKDSNSINILQCLVAKK